MEQLEGVCILKRKRGKKLRFLSQKVAVHRNGKKSFLFPLYSYFLLGSNNNTFHSFYS